jgi:hypothetical protein
MTGFSVLLRAVADDGVISNPRVVVVMLFELLY